MNFIGTEIPEDGYIKQFDLGIHGEIIPSVVRGNTATYKCDIHHCNTPSTSLRTLLVGGSADLGGDSGLFAFLSNNGVGDAFSLVGFRTLNTIY